jgi:prophage regulatory protein
METNMAGLVLSLPQVCQATSLSRSTIYDMMAKGLFPKSFRISPRRIVWRRATIEEWIERGGIDAEQPE